MKARLEAKVRAEGKSLAGWVKTRVFEELSAEDAAFARGRTEGYARGDAAGYSRGEGEGVRKGRGQATLMSREEGRKHGQTVGRVEGFLAGMIRAGFAHNERPWQRFDLDQLARELATQPEVARGVRELLAQSGAGEKFDELMRSAQTSRA